MVLHFGAMRRVGAATAAASVLAALLAITAAQGATADRSVASPSMESAILAVVGTLAAFALAGAFVMLVVTVVRGAHGPAGDGPPPTTRRDRIMSLVRALVLLGIFVLLLKLGMSHRAAIKPNAGAAAGVSGQSTVTTALPFNRAASATTAGVVALVIIAVAVGRHFMRFGRGRLRGPFTQFAPAVSEQHEAPRRLLGADPTGSPAAPISPESEADPRRSVMLAYHRFVSIMEGSERSRRDTETPTEYSLRLSQHEPRLPPESLDAAERLTATFNTARYSKLQLTEEDRSSAIADLNAIAATFRSAT